MIEKTFQRREDLEQAITPLLEFFAEINVSGEILDRYEESHGDFNALAEFSKDMNAIVLSQLIEDAHACDPEPNETYKKAYINWLKLNLLLFATVPYWRSRIGHMMWHFVCAADPNSYYPLVWEEHFDPRNWYRVGEPQRPADNSTVSAFSLPD